MTMVFMVFIGFVFHRMERVIHMTVFPKMGRTLGFLKKKVSLTRRTILLQATSGVNSTRHLARVSHANTFSRVAQDHIVLCHFEK